MNGNPLLTDAELAVLDLTAHLHRAFTALPEHHPGEHDEWAADLHRLQQRIMSRAATRAYPQRLNPLVPSEPLNLDTVRGDSRIDL